MDHFYLIDNALITQSPSCHGGIDLEYNIYGKVEVDLIEINVTD